MKSGIRKITPRYQRMDRCGIMVQEIHKIRLRSKGKSKRVFKRISPGLGNALAIHASHRGIRIWKVYQTIKKPVQRIKDFVIGLHKATWECPNAIVRSHSDSGLGNDWCRCETRVTARNARGG